MARYEPQEVDCEDDLSVDSDLADMTSEEFTEMEEEEDCEWQEESSESDLEDLEYVSADETGTETKTDDETDSEVEIMHCYPSVGELRIQYPDLDADELDTVLQDMAFVDASPSALPRYIHAARVARQEMQNNNNM